MNPPLIDERTWDRMTWHARQQWLQQSDRACRAMRAEIIALQQQLYRTMQEEIDEVKVRLSGLETDLEEVRLRTYRTHTFTEQEARRAHAARARGKHDPWTIAGDRAYYAQRKAREDAS